MALGPVRASCSICSRSSPMCTTPSMMAIVAGTAPFSRTMRSTSSAVSKFCPSTHCERHALPKTGRETHAHSVYLRPRHAMADDGGFQSHNRRTSAKRVGHLIGQAQRHRNARISRRSRGSRNTVQMARNHSQPMHVAGRPPIFGSARIVAHRTAMLLSTCKRFVRLSSSVEGPHV